MSSGLTPAKRFAVRASLVTGSTVALIVGAQTLITVDVQSGRMNADGSSAASDSALQSVDAIADSGIRVLRPATAMPAPTVEADTSQSSDELISQQPQTSLTQPQTQPSRRRPRTGSSH